MDQILGLVRTFSKRRYEEDFVDRLNFQLTPLILVISSSLIAYKPKLTASALTDHKNYMHIIRIFAALLPYLFIYIYKKSAHRAYFGGAEALVCWTPQQFRRGWDQYVNDYCLVENTYLVPPNNKSLPNDIETREESKISYYQWVSFALALQAVFFCGPHIFWRTFNWLSGLHLQAVVIMCRQVMNMKSSGKDIDSNTDMIANHIASVILGDRHVDKQIITNPIGVCFRFFTSRTACYMSCCYLVMKMLFFLNLIIQLTVMNFFLDIRNTSTKHFCFKITLKHFFPGSFVTWGIELLIRLLSGKEWQQTSVFPRVTVCDFQVRELGNLHRWSVQCVLPINMFNEKLYILLWFWMNFVLIATVINTVLWILNLIMRQRRVRFFTNLLIMAKSSHSQLLKDIDDARTVNITY
uniref:Innexin n=1 Tax=Syphacia muris TaxID=451379 RepID=A0A0N5AXY5_9BILA